MQAVRSNAMPSKGPFLLASQSMSGIEERPVLRYNKVNRFRR